MADVDDDRGQEKKNVELESLEVQELEDEGLEEASGGADSNGICPISVNEIC